MARSTLRWRTARPGTDHPVGPPAEREDGPGDVALSAERPAPASPTRAILRLLLLLAVAAGLWLLFELQGVILLLLLSMLFAYLIAPLVEFLCRPVTWRQRVWAIPRPLAIAMVCLALFASVGIASYVLLPLLGAQVTEFGRQVPSYMAYARDQLQAWQHFINSDHLPQGIGVILAILSGAELAGVAGIFLAIPAVAVLSVMHRHLVEYRGSGGLVSELLTPPVSAPDPARRMADPAATRIAYPPTDTPALEPH